MNLPSIVNLFVMRLYLFKVLMLVLFLLIIPYSLFAQYHALEPLEVQVGNEELTYTTLIGSNKLLYTFFNLFEPRYSSIKLIDLKNGTEYRYDYFPPATDTFSLFRGLLFHDDTIIAVGNHIHEDGMSVGTSSCFIIKLDTSLNFIERINLEANVDRPLTTSCIENSDHNLVIGGSSFVAEYTFNGALLNWNSPTAFGPLGGIGQRDDKSYFTFKTSGPIMYNLDSTLQLIEQFSYPPQTYLDCTGEYGIITDDETDSFFFGGVGNTLDMVLNNTEVLSIVRMDSVNNFHITYLDTLPDSVWGNRSFNLDSYIPEAKFIAKAYDMCYMGMNPNGSPFFSDCDAKINLYKLDENLDLSWKKILGGDANYRLQKVLATADTGCIVFANRYSAAQPENDLDIYYLKLDKYGNPQPGYLDTYTSIDTTPAMPLAQLLYDITTQALYLPLHLTGGSYRLYHSNGALLESFTATGYRIGLDKWPPGLYLYDYTAPDGHRYRGKVVK